LAIKKISRSEFNELLPEHHLLEAVSGEQVAWWAGEARRIIGTVGKGGGERNWCYVVLIVDEIGAYRVHKLQSGIDSRLVASAQLHHVMKCWRQPSVFRAETKPKLD
jgi:hypothetical protein